MCFIDDKIFYGLFRMNEREVASNFTSMRDVQLSKKTASGRAFSKMVSSNFVGPEELLIVVVVFFGACLICVSIIL